MEISNTAIKVPKAVTPTNSSQSDTLQVKSHFLDQSTNLVGEIIFLNNYAQN